MSRRIAQPVNQVRLTNVAIVRLNSHGKRFEIACYRNKIINWRKKIETEIDEVLQINSIFTNVSKGVLAKNQDLMEVFGTTNTNEVCRIILDRGEVQVSDKERQQHLDNLFRDIATIVSEKCVNPESNRPYTVSMIQNAMKEIHFSVSPNKNAKQQALEVIKRLKAHMPIARTKMHLRISMPATIASDVSPKILGIGETEKLNDKLINEIYSIEILNDPGTFREIEDLVRTETQGKM